MNKENGFLPIKADNEFKLIRAANIKILRDSGIILLLNGLDDLVSDSDLYIKNQLDDLVSDSALFIKNQNVISTFKRTDDWESITLIYMWGDPKDFNKKTPESLTLIASVAGENKIHLKFSKVEQIGEVVISNSVFDVSNQDKKKEMLDEIHSKFYGSITSNKRFEK